MSYVAVHQGDFIVTGNDGVFVPTIDLADPDHPSKQSVSAALSAPMLLAP